MEKSRSKWVWALILIVVLMMSVLVALCLTNPELLGAQPSESILKGGESTPANLFIVKDSLWESASVIPAMDQSQPSGIKFESVMAGTKIYAPFDGYVAFMATEREGSLVETIILADQMIAWDSPEEILNGKAVAFTAEEFDTSNANLWGGELSTDVPIKKGDLLASIVTDKGLGENNSSLIMNFYGSLVIDQSVVDLKDYLIESLENN
jgi:hypothetical protein